MIFSGTAGMDITEPASVATRSDFLKEENRIMIRFVFARIKRKIVFSILLIFYLCIYIYISD